MTTKQKIKKQLEKNALELQNFVGFNPPQFTENMKFIAKEFKSDPERMHVEADKMMCRFLEALGYGEGVKVFKEMKTWCA